MEALIGGIILGSTAALLGPPLVSGLSKVVTPVCEEIVKASSSAIGAVAGLVSTIGSSLGGSGKSHGKSGQGSSNEQGGFIQNVEEFGKDLVIDLVEGEAATFKEMVLLAAL